MIIAVYGPTHSGKTYWSESTKNKNQDFYLMNLDYLSKQILSIDLIIKNIITKFPILNQNNIINYSKLRELIFTNWEFNEKFNNYFIPIVEGYIIQILKMLPKSFIIDGFWSFMLRNIHVDLYLKLKLNKKKAYKKTNSINDYLRKNFNSLWKNQNRFISKYI